MSVASNAARHPLGTKRRPFVPNAVLAILIFVATEVMLFAGLISAYLIASSSALSGWPPSYQPRLPVAETAFNTAALLISGLFLYFANRAFRQNPRRARTPLLVAILLGSFFVIFQGAEWVQLIGAGLTMTSSTHGGFFYLIVGLHAAHAVAAIIALVFMYVSLLRGRLHAPQFWAAQIFWYFVVGVWPALYYLVYL